MKPWATTGLRGLPSPSFCALTAERLRISDCKIQAWALVMVIRTCLNFPLSGTKYQRWEEELMIAMTDTHIDSARSLAFSSTCSSPFQPAHPCSHSSELGLEKLVIFSCCSPRPPVLFIFPSSHGIGLLCDLLYPFPDFLFDLRNCCCSSSIIKGF